MVGYDALLACSWLRLVEVEETSGPKVLPVGMWLFDTQLPLKYLPRYEIPPYLPGQTNKIWETKSAVQIWDESILADTKEDIYLRVRNGSTTVIWLEKNKQMLSINITMSIFQRKSFPQYSWVLCLSGCYVCLVAVHNICCTLVALSSCRVSRNTSDLIWL